MWCKDCGRETNEKICELCGKPTEQDIPVMVYWCENCKTPIIKEINRIDNDICPICEGKTEYMASDLRPVFPEERLLFEIRVGKPLAYKEKTVWVSNNRYYIDGKVKIIPMSIFGKLDASNIVTLMENYKSRNNYDFFDNTIKTFILANRERLNYLIDEGTQFIRKVAAKYPSENIVVSFSGGKDSTVTSDLASKALSNPSLVHIFGNITLEFPSTIEYVQCFRENNPRVILKTAKNKEQDFYSVCEDIGPPARLLRWCSSMFKTGPITRVLNSLYKDTSILTFYGIRKCESVSRSKYNRIEDDPEVIKIRRQKVAAPIFLWKDIDIWLYLLGENVGFNDAYRLGYDRVGCWCCPNNNERAQFLSRIYMPEQSEKWRTFLVNFARKIGKPDAEVYIDSGNWKARQGGNGVPAAEDVKIQFTECITEDNANIYKLLRPVDESFINMFVPFGKIAKGLGDKTINEAIILDIDTNIPIISIQPYNQDGYDFAARIKTMNVEKHDDLQRMIGYQIRKYNACRKCLKCESLCKFGAISITGGEYKIDPDKCKHCKMCLC